MPTHAVQECSDIHSYIRVHGYLSTQVIHFCFQSANSIRNCNEKASFQCCHRRRGVNSWAPHTEKEKEREREREREAQRKAKGTLIYSQV